MRGGKEKNGCDLRWGEAARRTETPPDPLPHHRSLSSPKRGLPPLREKLGPAGVRTAGGCEVSWISQAGFREGGTQQCPSPANLHLGVLPIPRGAVLPQEGKGEGGRRRGRRHLSLADL